MAKTKPAATAAPELIEASAGVELISPEKYQEQLLAEVRATLPETHIAEMKAYCETLTIVGPNDREGYEAVQKSITALVKARTSLDKKRKELKEPFKKMGEAIDGEAKRLTALVVEVEEMQKRKKQEIDDFIEAERQRLENLKREAFNARVQRLTDAGVSYNGVTYYAGILNVTPTQVMEWDDATFEAEFAKLAEEVALQRAAEQRKQAEAEAARKAAQEAEEARRKAEAEAAELRAKLAALEAAQAPQPEPATLMGQTEPNTYLPDVPAGKSWNSTLNAFVPTVDPMMQPIEQPMAQPVSIKRTREFIDGFEAAKNMIANEMESGATPRNRAEWTAWIRSVQPEMLP